MLLDDSVHYREPKARYFPGYPVVKKGSNIHAAESGDMPTPVVGGRDHGADVLRLIQRALVEREAALEIMDYNHAVRSRASEAV